MKEEPFVISQYDDDWYYRDVFKAEVEVVNKEKEEKDEDISIRR